MLVEVYPQYEEEHYSDGVFAPPIGDAGSLDMAKALGSSYVGSRSAFLVGHNMSDRAARIESFGRYLTSKLPLGVNASRWQLTVDLVARMVTASASERRSASRSLPRNATASRWQRTVDLVKRMVATWHDRSR